LSTELATGNVGNSGAARRTQLVNEKLPTETIVALRQADFPKVAGQTIDSEPPLDTMNSGNLPISSVQYEADMKNARQNATACEAKAHFNYNKLQAVACMTTSAAVSIALIYWAVKSLF
jgi:hypothetical protein